VSKCKDDKIKNKEMKKIHKLPQNKIAKYPQKVKSCWNFKNTMNLQNLFLKINLVRRR
jgi:hypothetical protein